MQIVKDKTSVIFIKGEFAEEPRISSRTLMQDNILILT